MTQKQFKAVMGYNPSYFSKDGEGKSGLEYWDSASRPGARTRWRGRDTSDFPVENVSWEEAVEFCKKLTAPAEKKSGRTYRLPTEAEWEYACRGGATTSTAVPLRQLPLFQPGQLQRQLPLRRGAKGALCRGPARWARTSRTPGACTTCTATCRSGAATSTPDYYVTSPRRDPQGPSEGTVRTVRGGAWDGGGGACRSASRYGSKPTFRVDRHGFRVALVPSSPR